MKILTICVSSSVVAASIVVIFESATYDPNAKESNIAIAPSALWGGIETNLAVFCSEPPLPLLLIIAMSNFQRGTWKLIHILGCLPMLRPIFRKIIPTRSTNGTSSIDAVRLSNIVLPGGDLEMNGSARRGSRFKPSLTWAKKERRPSAAAGHVRLRDDQWQQQQQQQIRADDRRRSRGSVKEASTSEIHKMHSDESSQAGRAEA